MKTLLFILLIAVAGCHAADVAGPRLWSSSDMDRGAQARHGVASGITSVVAVVRGSNLEVSARLRDAQPGWTYQVFVNVDGDDGTGYASYGAEYLARGPGIDPEGLVVRTTESRPENPGGWGPVTGEFRSKMSTGEFKAMIPLSAVHCDGEGALVAIETYGPEGRFFAGVRDVPVGRRPNEPVAHRMEP